MRGKGVNGVGPREWEHVKEAIVSENGELSAILQQGCKAGWGLEESREVCIYLFVWNRGDKRTHFLWYWKWSGWEEKLDDIGERGWDWWVELTVMSVLGPQDPVTYGGAGPDPQSGYNSCNRGGGRQYILTDEDRLRNWVGRWGNTLFMGFVFSAKWGQVNSWSWGWGMFILILEIWGSGVGGVSGHLGG